MLEIILYVTFCMSLVGILNAWALMKRPVYKISYKEKYETMKQIASEYQNQIRKTDKYISNYIKEKGITV